MRSFIKPVSSIVYRRKMSSQFFADHKPPICSLNAKHHFENLTEKEQKYAYYLHKASHLGSRAVLKSVSNESNSIFDLILEFHKSIGGDYSALKSEFGDDQVEGYLEYASQFLGNLGNFKSFGDVKFIPSIDESVFTKIIKSSNDDKIISLYNGISAKIFSTNENDILLGLNKDQSHINSSYYVGAPFTDNEIKTVNRVLTTHKIFPENTRVEKISSSEFNLLIASGENSNTVPDEYPAKPIEFQIDGKNATLAMKFGDHSEQFAKIAENFEKAKAVAANETQVAMLDAYAKSFRTGSLESHRESQKKWVKDIGPKVESNIGFIETYRDPYGIRGEWEGLVSTVNQERTEKFGNLVNNAEKFIKTLPWDKAFEKDTFTPPDFTSLEVITFAGSGIPAGINIPNYDDIRINIGFKNVSLGNILNAKDSSNKPVTFIEEKLNELFKSTQGEAFEVQVGIHELLGHGSGKLLMQETDERYNFDSLNPPLGLDDKPVKTFYKKNTTWGSVFGQLAGPYEECRAESVAMYLITNRELLSIFGITDKKRQDEIIHIGYLLMARAGLVGLEFWDPNTKKWGQPHMQARFSILKTFLEAGEDFVKFKYSDKENFSDLRIVLDESKIETVGQPAIGKYLKELHVFKCSADFEGGSKLFLDRSSVPEDIAKFRDVVLSKKLPRKQFVQPNIILKEGNTLEYKEYPLTSEGMIQSFVEREV
ncbi:dipeptidyl-peptidase III [Saccharomycopsis crataegensis]|uniref:Dipeptidyl peptidase 3 n=1 Tax=Saccharomycopsis crataegensis TaxID=43959 RepID=A0AAV5QEH5_9ASCO|nr:dipeptidyl-peptidase III [Saccharomycopsis crataegensis]